ncbi:hypothetical protein H5407_00215 [Mitsuaria sp. WAJ17]|uniref:hypothetical protein n=1 Tax=Mitsuaria sp. WAJ17 TaxID=2761452 RepID=UPI0016021FA9|nr:hypothetical protein [Mitsuaria sp. WAJ17]MBB2483641.1 hypothetical protein [Mitsuaria sp. WAJ17]
MAEQCTRSRQSGIWHAARGGLLKKVLELARIPMRTYRVLLCSSALLAFTVTGDAQVHTPDAQTRFAERLAVEALNFRQGDLGSLADSKPFFTAAGWADFSKRLTGFVDPQGAATFTSSFTPSGPAIATKKEHESLTVTVPGVLKHESRNPQGGVSTTSYRAEIDIRVSASPFKIELLVPRTCGGAGTMPSCR